MKRLLSLALLSFLLFVQTATMVQASGSSPIQRNQLRWKGIQEILQSVLEFKADVGEIPAEISNTPQNIGSQVGSVDICSYLIPTYSNFIGWDPLDAGSYYTDCTSYSSGYTISVDNAGTITVSAPYAELGRTISVSGN